MKCIVSLGKTKNDVSIPCSGNVKVLLKILIFFLLVDKFIDYFIGLIRYL